MRARVAAARAREPALALDLYEVRDARDLGVEIKLQGVAANAAFSTMFVPHSLAEAEANWVRDVVFRVPALPRVVVDEEIDGDPHEGFEHIHTRAEARTRSG